MVPTTAVVGVLMLVVVDAVVLLAVARPRRDVEVLLPLLLPLLLELLPLAPAPALALALALAPLPDAVWADLVSLFLMMLVS